MTKRTRGVDAELNTCLVCTDYINIFVNTNSILRDFMDFEACSCKVPYIQNIKTPLSKIWINGVVLNNLKISNSKNTDFFVYHELNYFKISK